MKFLIKNWSPHHRKVHWKIRSKLIVDDSKESKIRRDIAISGNVLPIYADIGGSLILSEDGVLALYLFSKNIENESITSDIEEEWFFHAWARATAAFPLLLQDLEIHYSG